MTRRSPRRRPPRSTGPPVDWWALSPAPRPGRRRAGAARRWPALTPTLAAAAPYAGRHRRHRRRPPSCSASIQWYQVQDDGPRSLVGGGASASTGSPSSSPSSSAPPSSSARWSPTTTSAATAWTAPRSTACSSWPRSAAWSWPAPTTSSCCSSASRRCRSPLYVLAGSHLRRLRVAGVGASSTSCSAPSRRPSSSTASPWSTAPPARTNLAEIFDVPRAPPSCSRTGCCWPASPCCSSASASRWRPCRSTCGRPTSTRARPPRSPASWPRRPRRPASPALLRVFVDGLRDLPARTGSRSVYALAVAHAGGRLGAGRRADRREADAGLLVDQPRRLHPRRGRGRHRATGLVGRALFYLLAYTFIVLGSFAVVTVVGRTGDGDHVARRLPGPVAAPPAAGPRVHGAAAGPGRRAAHRGLRRQVRRDPRPRPTPSDTLLAIVAMLAAVIAAFLYLRIIVTMYMTDRRRSRRAPRASRAQRRRHRRGAGASASRSWSAFVPAASWSTSPATRCRLAAALAASAIVARCARPRRSADRSGCAAPCRRPHGRPSRAGRRRAERPPPHPQTRAAQVVPRTALWLEPSL